jgi:hypothetical protein
VGHSKVGQSPHFAFPPGGREMDLVTLTARGPGLILISELDSVAIMLGLTHCSARSLVRYVA